MNQRWTWRWVSAVLLLAIGGRMGRAGDLRISSFGNDKNLIFVSSDSSSPQHHYRIERATSLVPADWMTIGTVGGVAAGASVTSVIATDAACMFYRVVETLNSAAFVDGSYMAIDISGGTEAESYPVTHYRTLADVPGGADSAAYKTMKILMRLIPKGTFVMGLRSTDYPDAVHDDLHQVTLTEDFYLGVFEVTQRQWELVMGNRPSSFANVTYYQTRPVEVVSYYDIRENPSNSAINPNWPQSSQVHGDSFMGKLRAKTGLATLDLPTEAQWEYACRAGTTTALNSGHNLTHTLYDARMDEVGRHLNNGGKNPPYNCGPEAGTALAGSHMPNAWGLYDMHGNVLEWCLDWEDDYPGNVTDPQGASEGTIRVLRGGSFNNNAEHCRSAYRQAFAPTYRHKSCGFRVSFLPSGQQ